MRVHLGVGSMFPDEIRTSCGVVKETENNSVTLQPKIVNCPNCIRLMREALSSTQTSKDGGN